MCGLHGAARTTVSLIVVSTLSLIEGLLGGALAVIRLETTRDTVSGVGDGLLDLLLGRLGGVRSDLLLRLCNEKEISGKGIIRDGNQGTY